MKYFIGADLGTSSCKLLLSDDAGRVLATVSESYPVSYPRPGWSEQDPALWWDAFVSGLSRLLEGVDRACVAGIAVAGQMHGLVALDAEDRVIRPAILWNDGRTGKESDHLNAVIGEAHLRALTANISFAGFTAPKLLWMKKHEPERFARIRRIMLPKDYLVYRLTGVHATDYSDASGTLLLDVENKCWSETMLAAVGITRDVMPTLYESFSPVGGLLPDIARALGLSLKVTVAAGAGDNAGAAVGMGVIGEGGCNISLGTSGTVFVSSERFRKSASPALHSFCHADGGYHLMGCILSAASANAWFCDRILGECDYGTLQAEISDGMRGEGDVFFLPYLMGERSPHNDTDATGVFLGLRPDTSRAEMLLAVLEGVAFAIRDNVELIRAEGLPLARATLSGGGARSVLWCQILADVLGAELCLLETEEGPALGACRLAAVAAGAFSSLEEIPAPAVRTRFRPDPAAEARYEKKYQKFKKIYPSMKSLFREMKGE